MKKPSKIFYILFWILSVMVVAVYFIWANVSYQGHTQSIVDGTYTSSYLPSWNRPSQLSLYIYFALLRSFFHNAVFLLPILLLIYLAHKLYLNQLREAMGKKIIRPMIVGILICIVLGSVFFSLKIIMLNAFHLSTESEGYFPIVLLFFLIPIWISIFMIAYSVVSSIMSRIYDSPSLFRFVKNSLKVLRFIPLALLIVIALLSPFFLQDYYACGLKNGMSLYVPHFPYQRRLQYTCLSDQAHVVGNADLCKKASRIRDVASCYQNLAFLERDPNLCDNIRVETWSGGNRDSCLKNITTLTLNLASCEKILDLRIKSNCIKDVAVSTNNFNLCDRVGSEDRSYCYAQIAKHTKNALLCEKKISDQTMKNYCYFNVAQAALDKSLCDEIQNIGSNYFYSKEKCRDWIMRKSPPTF